uniref:cingulin n=1 Tax=uncultured Streptococcus sp. TaxID=83427 RepID=UPI0025D1AA4C|nr:cingulin [uncultured Streptococcus sp.]
MGKLTMIKDIKKNKRDKLFQEILKTERQEDHILDLSREYQQTLDEFLEDLSLITREAEEKLSISTQNNLFFQEKNEMDLIARNYVVKQMDDLSEEFRNVLRNLDIKREQLIKERNSLPWE